MSASPQSLHSHLSPDEAMRRYVEVVRHDSEPDPLFLRRLRGTVMNRFVAEREGSVVERLPRSSRMGRLGRACLYASVATAISVGGVMAASESAIPGEFLYPIKLGIEEMRMAIAPARVRDDLVAVGLAERIDELSQLVESGDTVRAAQLGASIGPIIEGLARTSDHAEFASAPLMTHLERLEAVLDRAPVTARRAIERLMGETLNSEKASGAHRRRSDGEPAKFDHAPGPLQVGAGGANSTHQVDTVNDVEGTPGHERSPKADGSPSPGRIRKPAPDDT